MLDSKVENTPSLWSKMLEDQLSSKRDRIANVFIFGDPNSGKKKFLDGLKKYTSIENQEGKRTIEDQNISDLEKVYIMDFKFIHLKKIQEDEVQEIGKINCFIYNRKYGFIQELLTKEMMNNLIFIFVVDLENPENLEESLNSWFDYVQQHILPFFQQFDQNELKELNENYIQILKKVSEFGRTNIEALKKTGFTQIITEEKEEDDENEKEVEQKNDENETNEEIQKQEKKSTVSNTKAFQIPILIVGTKSEKIEEVSNDNLKDFVEFSLQKFAKKMNSSLFTLSAFKDWNMDLISQFMLFTLFDKIPDNMSSIQEKSELKRMFIRNSSIDLEELDKKYQSSKNFKFPEKKKEIQSTVENTQHLEIKGINDFLNDVKNGHFYNAEEVEASSFINVNNMSGFNTSQIDSRAPERSQLGMKPTDRIRNVLKQTN